MSNNMILSKEEDINPEKESMSLYFETFLAIKA